MTRIFLSYSHKDEEYRSELEIHLASLKREGLIEVWHDRRIEAGDEFDREISQNLEDADVVLLLVSAYFINSDYCHEIEMRRALERHELGQARVIPVIVHPCDWKHSAFGKLNATPTDGKPISKHANFHDAYLDIVTSIRSAIEATPRRDSSQPSGTVPLGESADYGNEHPRSSNLRVTKRFSDREKDEFRDDSFRYISNFFESSLQELKRRNSEIDYSFTTVDSDSFTCVVYSHDERMSGCRISKNSEVGEFAYSMDESSSRGSYHEWLTIEHDGHAPYLKAGMREARNSKLTQEGAAEHFWSILIEPLQRQ